MKHETTSPLHKRLQAAFAAFLLAFALVLPGCGAANDQQQSTNSDSGQNSASIVESGAAETPAAADAENAADGSGAEATLADIPEYDGYLSVGINGNAPGFTESDAARASFVDFCELDFEGRSGQAFALIGPETLTDAPRDDISDIHPSCWKQHKYDFVEGGALYNRSHLIGHQLCGRDVAENLITGTRAFNAQGMLHYENLVADYVRSSGNHVLYRVTPLYAAYDLVARGVQMEAQSVEDGGAGVQFNVFVYNVEPGVQIDYVTGDNWESNATPAIVSVTPESSAQTNKAYAGSSDTDSAANSQNSASSSTIGNNAGAGNSSNSSAEESYILNTKSKKFHRPTCSAAEDISPANKSGYSGSRDELIEEGYTPCKICNP